MSNVSPRSAYSFIPGKSLGMGYFSHAHRSPQDRSCTRETLLYTKKKPIPRCAERAFSVSLLSSRWSGLSAKLSLEANESAKSPSPSLAGQSVIVNQAGLLAPVHRSFASSQRSLPSDCRLSSTCEITPCYSGVTAPAYEVLNSHTGFPMKQSRLCQTKPLHLIQNQYVIFMVR